MSYVLIIDRILYEFSFFFIQFLLPVEYTPAIMSLCRSLSNIATRKHEEKDILVNLQLNVNVPKGQALFARLIVLTG